MTNRPTIIKTEAVTLRIAPFSNTSHIVTWLTPHYGKIATIIKGACRPKSPVFGQYDIGFLCELLFYARNHNGLHIIKECSTINSRSSSRGNWQITAAISYLCHLASIATPDGAHAPELYSLLTSTLADIAPPTARISKTEYSSLFLTVILFQFEMRLMQLLGISPQLNNCTSCRANISTHENINFSAANGGIICSSCHTKSRPDDSLHLSGDSLVLLRRWQKARKIKLMPDCNAKQKHEIENILGSFLPYHLDLSPACRSVACQTINIPLSQS